MAEIRKAARRKQSGRPESFPPAVRPERIDDLVALWHESDSELELHEWLGWSWEQYKAWAEGSRGS